MGSSGYVGKIPIWQKEIEDAINAGKEIPFANLDERSKNWMLGRRSTSSSCAELSFNKPETEAVVQKIAQIQAQVRKGLSCPIGSTISLRRPWEIRSTLVGLGALALRCH